MKNFSDYTQTAINRHGLRGVNALARELHIKSSSMSRLNTGKSLPSEDTMVKLAELAGMPKEEALIDLNLWRSASQPEIQKVWQRLSKMIHHLCVVIFLSCAATPAKSTILTSKNFETSTEVSNSYLSDTYCILCIQKIFKNDKIMILIILILYNLFRKHFK